MTKMSNVCGQGLLRKPFFCYHKNMSYGMCWSAAKRGQKSGQRVQDKTLHWLDHHRIVFFCYR